MNAQYQVHALALAITSAPQISAVENLLGKPTQCATVHFFEHGWQAIASQAVPRGALWLFPDTMPDASGCDCIELFEYMRSSDQFLIYSATHGPSIADRFCQPEHPRHATSMSLDELIRLIFAHCVQSPFETDLPPPVRICAPVRR